MDQEEAPQPARSKALLAFREALESGRLPTESILSGLREPGALEEALFLLKRSHPRGRADDPWLPLRARLEAEVGQARDRRMQRWQTDPDRRTLRLRLEVRHPACLLHPPALQSALARALLEAGLPLAMGLEKSPRPMVRLGHPLPQGIEGLSEWADACLRQPSGASAALPARISACCPEGLRVLQAEEVPNHASPVLDLCRVAQWAWPCPPGLRGLAEERLAAFEAAASYTIAKQGKVSGHKQVKQVEVRPSVLALGWEGDTLRLSTRLSAGEALNPVKLLAGVLEVEATAIGGLVRLGVELGEDPRLAQSSKYEPKLHNIFEDAVLLDSASNILLIEEEDDEPILLRREAPVPRGPRAEDD